MPKTTWLQKCAPLRTALGLFMVFGLSSLYPLEAKTISFTRDDSVILNPERGLAKQMIVGDASIDELSELRDDRHTLAWGIIRLDAFRNTPVLPDSNLNEFTRWFDEVRANQVKSVLRIVYHQKESFHPAGAAPAIQEAHLSQLGTEVSRTAGVCPRDGCQWH